MVLSEARRGADGSQSLMGAGLQFGMVEKFWRPMVVMVATNVTYLMPLNWTLHGGHCLLSHVDL